MIALLIILRQQIEEAILQIATDIASMVVYLLNVGMVYDGVKERENFVPLHSVRPKGRDPT